MFLLGPPGTAKSALGSRTSPSAWAATAFDYLLTRFHRGE
ncbi:hypothetical protein [Chthoniobacter flavus]